MSLETLIAHLNRINNTVVDYHTLEVDGAVEPDPAIPDLVSLPVKVLSHHSLVSNSRLEYYTINLDKLLTETGGRYPDIIIENEENFTDLLPKIAKAFNIFIDKDDVVDFSLVGLDKDKPTTVLFKADPGSLLYTGSTNLVLGPKMESVVNMPKKRIVFGLPSDLANGVSKVIFDFRTIDSFAPLFNCTNIVNAIVDNVVVYNDMLYLIGDFTLDYYTDTSVVSIANAGTVMMTTKGAILNHLQTRLDANGIVFKHNDWDYVLNATVAGNSTSIVKTDMDGNVIPGYNVTLPYPLGKLVYDEYGNILVSSIPDTNTFGYRVVIERYKADGTQDTTFGTVTIDEVPPGTPTPPASDGFPVMDMIMTGKYVYVYIKPVIANKVNYPLPAINGTIYISNMGSSVTDNAYLPIFRLTMDGQVDTTFEPNSNDYTSVSLWMPDNYSIGNSDHIYKKGTNVAFVSCRYSHRTVKPMTSAMEVMWDGTPIVKQPEYNSTVPLWDRITGMVWDGISHIYMAGRGMYTENEVIKPQKSMLVSYSFESNTYHVYDMDDPANMIDHLITMEI